MAIYLDLFASETCIYSLVVFERSRMSHMKFKSFFVVESSGFQLTKIIERPVIVGLPSRQRLASAITMDARFVVRFIIPTDGRFH